MKRFSISEVTDLPDYDVFLEKLKEISDGLAAGVTEVEKPMFDQVNEVPDFLVGEKVEVIE